MVVMERWPLFGGGGGGEGGVLYDNFLRSTICFFVQGSIQTGLF